MGSARWLTCTLTMHPASACMAALTAQPPHAQVEQLRAELAARGGSAALASTPTAPSPVGADTGSPQAGGLNGSAEVGHFRGSARSGLRHP